uniref:CXXC-type domain-containing protein n=1 Tax=Terrapene triunguis TaxID=2587831 RepID=A0A674JZ33_9SAUR
RSSEWVPWPALPPNGEKFRSKIELTRFLGPSQDLTNFDFKNGVLREPPPKVPGGVCVCVCQNPRGRPDHGHGAENSAGSAASAPPGATPPEAPGGPAGSPGIGAGCRSGVSFPPGPWLRRLKALPLLQRVGCGACQACQIPEDCGICTVCAVRAKNPELRIGRKCLLRRCLKIVKKGFGCGVCQGCQATEDCGSCYICLRRLKPGLKRQWKCLKRRCLKKKVGGGGESAPAARCPPAPGPGCQGRSPPAPHHSAPCPAPHPAARSPAPSSTALCSKSRRNRKCGECEACLLKADCGRCDFCRDKPKFGGENLKRQKCRWRQCLRFAMVGALPARLVGSGCSGRAGARCRPNSPALHPALWGRRKGPPNSVTPIRGGAVCVCRPGCGALVAGWGGAGVQAPRGRGDGQDRADSRSPCLSLSLSLFLSLSLSLSLSRSPPARLWLCLSLSFPSPEAAAAGGVEPRAGGGGGGGAGPPEGLEAQDRPQPPAGPDQAGGAAGQGERPAALGSGQCPAAGNYLPLPRPPGGPPPCPALPCPPPQAQALGPGQRHSRFSLSSSAPPFPLVLPARLPLSLGGGEPRTPGFSPGSGRGVGAGG